MATGGRQFGISVRNGNANLGSISTQPIPRNSQNGQSSPVGSTTAVITAKPGVPNRDLAGNASMPTLLPGAASSLNIPIRNDDIQAPMLGNIFTAGMLNAARTPIVPTTFVPELAVSTLPKKQYAIDKLDLGVRTIDNGRFKPVMDGGVSTMALRPEILSMIDFSPIFEKGDSLRLSPAGTFIDVQYKALNLRQETLTKMVDAILLQEEGAKNVFEETKNNFLQELNYLNMGIRNIAEIQRKALKIKNNFNIKLLADNQFTPDNRFLSLKSFFAEKMQYTSEKYNSFTNSKIMLQILFDLRSILENYSISLLDLEDPDRKNDFSPTDIDKTYTISNGFSFNISDLRSASEPINATNKTFFNTFLNTLPSRPNERTRILLTLLTKELLISKNLGKESFQKQYKNIFGTVPEGNPFDNIIGEVGNSIFQPPEGPSSLASLMFINNVGGSIAAVLPFESKYVDSQDQNNVYAPGSAYFVDSIFNIESTDATWNTKPLVDFCTNYQKVTNDNLDLIYSALSFDNPTEPLKPHLVFSALINYIAASVNGTTSIARADSNQSALIAIIKLAQQDNELKNMLFQFCLLAGMKNNGTTQQKEAFLLLAKELKTLRNLEYAINPENPISPSSNLLLASTFANEHLDKLAEKIENKISSLTTTINPNIYKSSSVSTIYKNIAPKPITNVGLLNTNTSFASSIGKASSLSSLYMKDLSVISVVVQRSNIKKILLDASAAVTKDKRNFINIFTDTLNNLILSAQNSGANTFLLDDGSIRTKYNFLSMSTVSLLLFEIINSIYTEQISGEFQKDKDFFKSTIIVDTGNNSFFTDASSQIATLAQSFENFTVNIIKNKSTESPQITKESITGQMSMKPSNLELRLQNLQGSKSNTGNISVLKSTGINNLSPGNKASNAGSLLTGMSELEMKSFRQSPAFNALANTDIGAAKILLASATFKNFPQEPAKTNQEVAKFVKIKSKLENTIRKLYEEQRIVANALRILETINSISIKGSLSEAAQLEKNNRDSIQEFLTRNNLDGTALNLLQNPGQLKLASIFLRNSLSRGTFKTKTQNGNDKYIGGISFVNNDILSDNEYKLMQLMMSENEYLPDTNNFPERTIKVFSVGIPSGFTGQLVDRVNVNSIGKDSFLDRQSDIIEVSVYRRDARFDDIIFKPQKFFFDMSLFLLEQNINNARAIEVSDNFNSVLNSYEGIQLSDVEFTTPNSFYLDFPKLSLQDILQDPKYSRSLTTNSQKAQLFRNHITSYLLTQYVNLLTGMKIEEGTFLIPKEPLTKKEQKRLLNLGIDPNTGRIGPTSIPLIKILNQYVLKQYKTDKNVQRIIGAAPGNLEKEDNLDRFISGILAEKTISEEVKDYYRLFLFGTNTTQEQAIRNLIVRPKIFDRIFHIPVNIDNFEVDLELTLSTQSGRQSFNQSYVQDNLIKINENTYKLKPRGANDIVFEDYFIRIETAIDKEP